MMGTGPFKRVDTILSNSNVAADPAIYWRTGFTLPAVAAGYAYEREEVHSELIRHLKNNDVAVVGGVGTGKSTVCKSAACAWRDRGLGPIYYATAPRPTEPASALDSVLPDSDRHALVVLEDATVDGGELAVELVEEFGTRTDVSLLLEVDRAVLTDRRFDGQLQSLLGDALTVCDLPPLDRDGFVAAVETFESLTDETLTDSPATVFDTVREQGVEGSELLHLAHRVLTDSDGGASSLEQTVQTLHDRHGGDSVSGDLALLVNLLNAADLPLYPEFLFGLEDANPDIDAAVGVLRGDLLIPQERSPPFRTYHRLFSVLYLERVVETSDHPHEQFARAFRAILRAMDADRRADLWAWVRDHSVQVPDNRSDPASDTVDDLLLSAVRTRRSAVGPRAQVVQQLFSIGRSRPALAPLFGACDRATLDLEEYCSPVTTARAVLTRGRMYFDLGDHEQALAEYDHALALLSDAPSRIHDRLLVACLIACGRVATRQAEFDRARNYHEEAHAVATDIGDRQGRARSHVHQGVVALKTGDLRRATAHLIGGERLFRARDDGHGVAQARQRLGIAYLRRGKLELAAEVLDDTIDRYQRLGARVDLARAQNNRGLVAYERGDFDTAATYFRRSLTSNRDTGRQAGVMMNHLNLGNIAVDRNDDSVAEQHYREALSLAREVDDRDTEAILMNNLGVLALEQGDLEAAADWYRQSRTVARDIGDSRGEARAHNNLGEVARERGAYDTAVDHHQTALELYERAGDRAGQASCHFHLGEVARDRGNLHSAADRFEQALGMYQDIENEQRTGETLAALGRLARQRDDPQQALNRLLESARLLEDGRERDAVLDDLHDLVTSHDRDEWRAQVAALPDSDLSANQTVDHET